MLYVLVLNLQIYPCSTFVNLFRSPGTPCGCGSGDSGCSECGCCRTCAGEGINDLEGVGGVEVAAGGEGAGGAVPVVNLIR